MYYEGTTILLCIMKEQLLLCIMKEQLWYKSNQVHSQGWLLVKSLSGSRDLLAAKSAMEAAGWLVKTPPKPSFRTLAMKTLPFISAQN